MIKNTFFIILLSTNCWGNSSIKSYLKSLNVRHVDIIYAQARRETGNFKSAIYKENHNPFGFKRATQRPTTAIGTKRGHAYYKSVREACIDYALYFAKYCSKLTREEFIEYVCANYSADKNYKKKLLCCITK